MAGHVAARVGALRPGGKIGRVAGADIELALPSRKVRRSARGVMCPMPARPQPPVRAHWPRAAIPRRRRGRDGPGRATQGSRCRSRSTGLPPSGCAAARRSGQKRVRAEPVDGGAGYFCFIIQNLGRMFHTPSRNPPTKYCVPKDEKIMQESSRPARQVCCFDALFARYLLKIIQR